MTAPEPSAQPTQPTPESEGVHEAARRDKMRKLIEMGVDPWGQRFDDRLLIGDIRARTGEIVFRKETGETIVPPSREAQPDLDFRKWLSEQGKGDLEGPKVRAAGRIVLHRDKGKLRFIDIQDWSGRLQLLVGQAQVGEESWKLAECCDLGDLVGVDGEFKYTKLGEPTIFAEKLHFLAKSVLPPPDKHAGLADPELRHRMRYLDLAYTEGVLPRFLSRTKVVASIRRTLNEQGYCEIEGPTLHTIAGGAAARPFITHHNTLDMQLYLRIALELHLKRLLVGGMERVYELGRVYRNEGISPKHNPEFTMLEVYQAYGNYETMMDLTENILCDAIRVLDGNFVRPWGDKQIDFTPPFQRKTYDELFREHTGIDPQDATSVKALAERIGFETAGKHPDVIKSEVFEEKVEDALVGPIFVTDYPASICPLTKRKTSNPAVAERFELFVHGMEVANAYTELNDPDLQEQLFRTQLAGQAADDSMAKMDTDFVRALKHAMPPAGGLGIGIDRLIMLLTNTQTIRDVILFPVLRPE
ncbi:lysine--tRNA ligase [Anatilimnocola aggregata]|nr:lysine--tRNA ligase [Anatilimnocola aggregata]